MESRNKLVLATIKQGDLFYMLEKDQIYHYAYLCPHPSGATYHILINMETQEPIKVHRDALIDWLDKDIRTSTEAEMVRKEWYEFMSKETSKELEANKRIENMFSNVTGSGRRSFAGGFTDKSFTAYMKSKGIHSLGD